MPPSQTFLRQRKAASTSLRKIRSKSSQDSDRTVKDESTAAQSDSKEEVVWGKTPDGQGLDSNELSHFLNADRGVFC
jgi:hypothetical protein